MNKKVILFGAVLILICLISVGIWKKFDDKEVVKNIDINVDLDNGDEKIDWNSLESYTLNLDKSVTIDSEGVYNLTGSISNGMIMVNTSGNVKLVLNNVSINNNNGPCIVVEDANMVVIELSDGSVNTFSDGESYSNEDYEGCIFSRSDLIFSGTGTLNLVSNYLDGIVSLDDLKIINGKYFIQSNDDGIRGRDSVYIIDGEFVIESNGDGIKSTNDVDDNKGFINIVNGKFDIDSDGDGIQALRKLIIYDGEFDIKAGAGSSSVSSAIYKSFYGGSSYDDTSTKGLKAEESIFIDNGSFLIDSSDDSIHTNGSFLINAGTINISSGDDGIHADDSIIINGGKIVIDKSYEGIESVDIVINGGDISIVSNDDGINISGGNDSSSMGGRPGENMMSSGNGTLEINGGSIYVNASGDGLDANGSVVINGGEIHVDGPVNDGNGAIDYDVSFDINAGDFVAVGSSGMAQEVSDSSEQYSIMFNLDSTYSGELSLVDSAGNVLISYTPAKEYQSVVVSSNDISKNNTYSLKINGSVVAEVKVSSISTVSGNFHGMGNGGGNRPPSEPGRR